MREYIVYRHGGVASVEGEAPADHDKRPVARLQAHDADDACRRATGQVALAAGQWLSAESADEVDAKVNELSLRAEALGEAEPPEGGGVP
jgi:hypothetical protein